MKENLRKEKGITLLALIITIIVLLILAMVSIALVVNEGIINHAQTATEDYKKAEEKEKIELAYKEYEMAKIENKDATLTVPGADVAGDKDNGWTIIFDETEHKYELDPSGKIEEETTPEEDFAYLRKYLLGEDEKGISIYSITEEEGDEYGYPVFTDREVQCFIGRYEFMYENAICIKYKNRAYKLEIESDREDYYNQTHTTKSVTLVYTPDEEGKEGTTVKYSYDGTKENEKDWTILYNNGDNYEIVSPDLMGSLELGANDTEAQGNSEFEKVVYSYNNAVTRINNYASTQITNDNKISVRSVGSNPNNPNEDNPEMYTSDLLESWNCKYEGVGEEVEINGVLKRADESWQQDYIRMAYWGVNATEGYHWFASRMDGYSSPEEYDVGPQGEFFFGLMTNYRGYGAGSGFFKVIPQGIIYLGDEKSSYSPGIKNAVRPVVKIEAKD